METWKLEKMPSLGEKVWVEGVGRQTPRQTNRWGKVGVRQIYSGGFAGAPPLVFPFLPDSGLSDM